MRAGDLAVEIGDGRDHRRPGLGRRIAVRTIVAAWVEAQACGSVQSRDAAFAQIRFHECARNRLRHGEEAACRFRRSGRCRTMGSRSWSGSGSGSRQAEKAPGLSATSRNSTRPQLSRMTSRRSPCSPSRRRSICRRRPCRIPALSAGRTGSGRACSARRRPASSGPRGGRWRDSDGTPPRHRARGGAPVRRHRAPSSRRRPLGDARERIAFQHLRQDRRAGRRRSARTCAASTR